MADKTPTEETATVPPSPQEAALLALGVSSPAEAGLKILADVQSFVQNGMNALRDVETCDVTAEVRSTLGTVLSALQAETEKQTFAPAHGRG